MHAIEVSETGGPEVLRYVDTSQPKPGHGELLIKAEAIGVNFIDTYFRSGQYPREVPFVLGSEVCGTVAAVGEGAGDRLQHRRPRGVRAAASGAYAEFCHRASTFDRERARRCQLRGGGRGTAERPDRALPAEVGVFGASRRRGAGACRRGWRRADPDAVGHQLGARVITTVSTPEKARAVQEGRRRRSARLPRRRRRIRPADSCSSPEASAWRRSTTASAPPRSTPAWPAWPSAGRWRCSGPPADPFRRWIHSGSTPPARCS